MALRCLPVTHANNIKHNRSWEDFTRFNLTIMVLPLKGSSFIDIQDSGTLLRCNDTNFTKSETKRTFDQRLNFMQITKSTRLNCLFYLKKYKE
jgi:hypothetical protein